MKNTARVKMTLGNVYLLSTAFITRKFGRGESCDVVASPSFPELYPDPSTS